MGIVFGKDDAVVICGGFEIVAVILHQVSAGGFASVYFCAIYTSAFFGDFFQRFDF